MADLKSSFSPELVKRLGADIARVHPPFDAKSFTRQATAGLDRLELLDRGRHIAVALAAHLPPGYPQAVEVLLASLGPEHQSDELIGAGMAPFFYLPHTIFVSERGLGDFEASLRAQYELTKRFSAEGSIRAFINRDPERTLARLGEWTGDANPHVRRLASEGTRLRLPWAPRVPWLDAHPDRVLALLERLKDDPSSMVRRSVANNLNDLGKVHPTLLADVAAKWLRDATAERRALIEHALRSAVKRGEPWALRLLGYGGRASVAVSGVRISPQRVKIGGTVSVAFTLVSRARKATDLLVDLAVHFVKARGQTSRKVFKLRRVTLPPGGSAEFATTVSLKVHTTRKPNPGDHAVDVVINGVPQSLGEFTVVAAPR